MEGEMRKFCEKQGNAVTIIYLTVKQQEMVHVCEVCAAFRPEYIAMCEVCATFRHS